MATGDRNMTQVRAGMVRNAPYRSFGTHASAAVWRVVFAAALTLLLVAGQRPSATLHAAAAGAGKSAAPLHLYWANDAGVTIGRSLLDGSHVDNNFITGGAAPERLCGIAIAGKYLYWGFDVESGMPSIGRARLDGTGVNENFIPDRTGPVCGVATDRRHLYWASYAFGNIGRANLDGTVVDSGFISPILGLSPDLNAPCVVCAPTGVAVDSKHIYWVGVGSIGRANLDGTNMQQTFITGVDFGSDLKVASKYIYWADQGGSVYGAEPAWANRPAEIGRARLDGTHVQRGLVTGPGVQGPCGLAVTDKYIYWDQNGPGGNGNGTTIGRANLDGAGVLPNFISGLQSPCGIAVGP